MKSCLFKKIAIVARLHTPKIAVPLMHIVHFLQQHGSEVLIESETAQDYDLITTNIILYEQIGQHVDLVIVIGGDGTMLSVSRLLAPFRVPIIGVNQGRLGFTTDITMPDMEQMILQILNGNFVSEQRILLQAAVYRAGRKIQGSLAFNEVALSRGSMGSMIEFEVTIDKSFVYSQRADGIIISTPTGSTAYSLAAGGPIVHPTVPAIIMVPICPQFLNNRPIVVNDNCVIEVSITRGQDARVFFDSHIHAELRESDQIIINRYQHSLSILHPVGYSYYDVLRKKLHWGAKFL